MRLRALTRSRTQIGIDVIVDSKAALVSEGLREVAESRRKQLSSIDNGRVLQDVGVIWRKRVEKHEAELCIPVPG